MSYVDKATNLANCAVYYCNDVKHTLAAIDAFRLTPGLKTHLNHVRYIKQKGSKK